MACAMQVHCNGMCHASRDRRYVACLCWANPWANPGQTLGKPLWFLGKPLQPSVLACNKYRTEWQEACGGIRPSNPIIMNISATLCLGAHASDGHESCARDFTLEFYHICFLEFYEPIVTNRPHRHTQHTYTLTHTHGLAHTAHSQTRTRADAHKHTDRRQTHTHRDTHPHWLHA